MPLRELRAAFREVLRRRTAHVLGPDQRAQLLEDLAAAVKAEQRDRRRGRLRAGPYVISADGTRLVDVTTGYVRHCFGRREALAMKERLERQGRRR